MRPLGRSRYGGGLSISVITPSFNMRPYLPRCCASVADQQGARYEHIVVDGGSTDGSVEWLRTRPNISSIVGPDQGMYDAINKGLHNALGDIVAYLSCDEQYLPGALSTVSAYFEKHPQVDVLFGDTLVTRGDGSLICFRKAYPAIWPMIATSDLYNFPSSMFLRGQIVDAGYRFDPSFRYSGDAEFVVRLLRKGYRSAILHRYLSAFALTGSNRGQHPAARAENVRLRAMLPRWVPRARIPLNVARLLMKAATGAYFQRPPLRYALYAGEVEDDAERTLFETYTPSPRWRLA